LEIVTAAMRLDSSRAEVKRNLPTPALTRFIKDSCEERLELKVKLAKVNR
jgi:hypothetical protein